MPKQIIIAEQHHIAAVFSEDQIQELVVATGNQQVGDIFLGTVENVIPGIDAAFVNIGDAERNGFIHVSDLGPLRLKKSAGAITELLAPQQTVLVQVMKEPTGNKGPRLTGNVSLPGRYLVLIPYGKGVNLSRRIKSENERSRLRALGILLKPAGMGLLIRTEAEGKAEEAIMEDLEFLQKQWEETQREASSLRPPVLLNRDDDFIQRVLRDMYSNDVNRIVVDSGEGVKRVKKQLLNWSNGRSPEGVLIDEHREYQPILEFFRVNAAIKEALKPRVDLPSGGYVIIEPTEALTVIDVNSGSFTHSATSRETVLWTNCEAATEIARQLRLRNIGGVIIIDFIDMDSRRDQLKLLEHFTRVLRADKSRPQIAQLSELGLVELTRKRQGKNIYELFGETCPHCTGLGHLVRLPGAHGSISLPNYNLPVVVKSLDKPVLDEKPILFDDYSAAEDSADLELLHHPSYQEQGAGGSRRRRRRRPEMGSREENGVTISKEVELTNIPKPERKERTLLSRSSRRDETKLEKVMVEMTDEELDIYALMGVSPLIRLDQEFKDPKSVIVHIKRIGDQDREKELESVVHEDRDNLLPESESESELESPLSSETFSDLQQDEEMDDSDNGRPLIRRRRRRSSALQA
jgi:ribonuclease E